MKKLSSILVLMLIVLMLFVSCNNSTPTKEETSNSGSSTTEGETSKLEERDAIDDDVELTGMIFSAIGEIQSLLANENPNDNPANVEIDKINLNTLNFKGEGCTVNVKLGEGNEFSVTFIGSASITSMDNDLKIFKYDCELEEGTIIAGIPHTVTASITVNTTTYSFEVHQAIIDGKKVNNLAAKLNASTT